MTATAQVAAVASSSGSSEAARSRSARVTELPGSSTPATTRASTRRTQAWAGTDRQCRGRLMAVLREADGPVHASVLEAAWPHDDAQRSRCLETLVSDGLAARTGPSWGLPA
jgi:A/G-specific adenine glycosylase